MDNIISIVNNRSDGEKLFFASYTVLSFIVAGLTRLIPGFALVGSLYVFMILMSPEFMHFERRIQPIAVFIAAISGLIVLTTVPTLHWIASFIAYLLIEKMVLKTMEYIGMY